MEFLFPMKKVDLIEQFCGTVSRDEKSVSYLSIRLVYYMVGCNKDLSSGNKSFAGPVETSLEILFRQSSNKQFAIILQRQSVFLDNRNERS